VLQKAENIPRLINLTSVLSFYNYSSSETFFLLENMDFFNFQPFLPNSELSL